MRTHHFKSILVALLLFIVHETTFSQTQKIPGTSLDSLISRTNRLGYLRGTVLISGTEIPLSGVQVLLANPQVVAHTDARGEFTFSYVPPGRYTLTASLLGYSPLSWSIRIKEGEQSRLSFAMTPDYSNPGLHTTGGAEIFVFDKNTGLPEVAAQINLVESGRVGTVGFNGSYRTDNLSPGKYHITVTSFWPRQNVVDSVKISAGSLTVRFIGISDSADVRNNSCPLIHRKLRPSTPIAPFESCSISGILRDFTTGETLKDAHLFLAPYADEAYSDSAGHFTVPNLRPGRYCLTITCLGYSTTTMHGIIVESKDHVFLNLSLEPAMMMIVN